MSTFNAVRLLARRMHTGAVDRGSLRIYLGAAPGVGKTYAMLNEGRRRRARGTDVVVGIVHTHGRPATAAQLGDLEVVPLPIGLEIAITALSRPSSRTRRERASGASESVSITYGCSAAL